MTESQVRRAISVLRRHRTVDDACAELGVSRHVLKRALNSFGKGKPSDHLAAGVPVRVESAAPDADVDDISRLVDASRRGPVRLEDLCNRLDMAPRRVRALISAAQSSGKKIHLENEFVGLRVESDADERIRKLERVAPTVGGKRVCAVISDTHLGSKYCLRKQLQEFMDRAFKDGVRDTFHPGDWLDGMYDHSRWEQSHTGIEAQTEDLFDTLPEKKGHVYHGIMGNHDETFTSANGIDVADHIMNFFAKRGRNDIKIYGYRGAFLEYGGAVFHLWHPKGGGSYALSYKLQKKIEAYSSGEKPNVLLTGHYHKYVHCYERGVHGFLCPTFQGGGSSFGKSLIGNPAIGGMILSFEMTEDGTMRSLSHDYRAYFERERPHRIEDHERYREETAAGDR